MAWWDSRHYRACGPSWSAPSPMRRKDRSIVHGIARHENAPSEMDGVADGALFSIVEEENSPVTDPALLVNVSIHFTDPIIRSRYHRTYASSQAFTASDRMCRGLLGRIEHCCEELITRKDPEALDMFTNDTSTVKRQRYGMTFQIVRRGSGQWAEKTFRSYQKQPLTVGFTKEVILASDKMVAHFLRHHDRGFRWFDGSIHDDHQEPQTFAPSEDGPPLLCCIPEPRFNETTQSFDMVPGYTIMLSFRSRTKRPARTEFGKVLNVHSEQDTPLNLELGEKLLSYVWESVQGFMATKRHEFDEEHTCDKDGSDPASSTGCPHLDDDAVRVDVRVSNNLGPAYDHLQREYHSQLTIFRQENLHDCLEFVRYIEHEMLDARDRADCEIGQKDDFELRVLELKSPTWSFSDPCVIKLDHWETRPRRTIEAILDRVQTGISEVLHGNNLTVHIIALKRDHLVMDKTLVARQARDSSKKRVTITQLQKEALVFRLRSRIRQDIDKVCKNTCLLKEEEAPGDDPFLDATGLHYVSDELPTQEPDVGHILGDSIQGAPKVVPVRSLRRTFSMMARPVSRRASKPEFKVDRHSGHQLSGSRPVTPSTPTGSIRSSYTGTGSPRAFPLLPARYALHAPNTISVTGVTHVLEPEPTSNRAWIPPESGNMASLNDYQSLGYIVSHHAATPTILHDFSNHHQASAEISHVQEPAGTQPARVTDSMEPLPTTEVIPSSQGSLSNEVGSGMNQPSDRWDSASEGTTYEDEVVGAKTWATSGEEGLREALPVNTPLDLPQALPVQHGDHVQALDAQVADVVLANRPVGDGGVDTFTPMSTPPQLSRTDTDSWAAHNIFTVPSHYRNRPCSEHADDDQASMVVSRQAGTPERHWPLLLCPATIATTNTSQPFQLVSGSGLNEKEPSSFVDRNVAVRRGQDTGDTDQAHVQEHHTLPVQEEGPSSIVEASTESETPPCHEHNSVIVGALPSPPPSPSPSAEIPSEEQTRGVDDAEVPGNYEEDLTASTANVERSSHISEEHETKEGVYARPPATTTSCPVLHLRSGRGAMITDSSVEVERRVTPEVESSATPNSLTQSHPVDLLVSPPHPSALRATEGDTFVVEDIQLANQKRSIGPLLEPDVARGDEGAPAGEQKLLEEEKGPADEPLLELSPQGVMLIPEAQDATLPDHSSSVMLPASEHERIIKSLSLVEGSSQQALELAPGASAAKDDVPAPDQILSSTTMCRAEGCLDFSLAEAREAQCCPSAEPHDKLARPLTESPAAIEPVNHPLALARILVGITVAADNVSASDRPVAESVILANQETSSDKDGDDVITEGSIKEVFIATAESTGEERLSPTGSTASSGLQASCATDVDEKGAFEATAAAKEAMLLAEIAIPGNNAAIVESIAVVDETVSVRNVSAVDRVEEEPAKATVSDLRAMTKIEDGDIFEAETSGMMNPMIEKVFAVDMVATGETLLFEDRDAALEAVGKGTSMGLLQIARMPFIFRVEEQLPVPNVDPAGDQTAAEVPRATRVCIEVPPTVQDVEPNQENGTEKRTRVFEEEAKIVSDDAANYKYNVEGVLTDDDDVTEPAAEAQPSCNTPATVGELTVAHVAAKEEPSSLESSAPGPDASLEAIPGEPAAQRGESVIAGSSDMVEEVTIPMLPEHMSLDEREDNAKGSLTHIRDICVEESQHSAEIRANGAGGKTPTSAVEDSARRLLDSWAQDSVRLNDIKDIGNCLVYPGFPPSPAHLGKQSVSSLGDTGPDVDQSLSSNFMAVVRTQDVVSPDVTFEPQLLAQVSASHTEGCLESLGREMTDSRTPQHVENPEHGSDVQAQVSGISGVTPAAKTLVVEERLPSEGALVRGTLGEGYGECRHGAGVVQHRPPNELPRVESSPVPPDRSATTTRLEDPPGFQVSAPLILHDFTLPDIMVQKHGQTSFSSGSGNDVKTVSMARGKDSSSTSQAPARSIRPSMRLGSQCAGGEVEGTISTAPEERPPDVGERMVLFFRDEQVGVGSEARDAAYENREVQKTPDDATATESAAETAHDVSPQTVLMVKRNAHKEDEPLTETRLKPADETANAVESSPETAPVVVHKSLLGPAPAAVAVPTDQAGPSTKEAAHMYETTFGLPRTYLEEELGWTLVRDGRSFGEESPQEVMKRLLKGDATLTSVPWSEDQQVFDAAEGDMVDETGVESVGDEVSRLTVGQACVEIPVSGGEASEDEAGLAGDAAQQEDYFGEDTSRKVASELPTCQEMTGHALEAAVAPCLVQDGAICEVPEDTDVDRANPVVFAALPTSLPPANITRAEHRGQQEGSEADDLQNTAEELPLDVAEASLKVQTSDSSLASSLCSLNSETGASRLQDDPGLFCSGPEVSASKATDNFVDEIANLGSSSLWLQVGTGPCREGMAIKGRTAFDVAQVAQNAYGGSIVQPLPGPQYGDTPDVAADLHLWPEQSLSGSESKLVTDIVEVMQPAAPAESSSAISSMRMQLFTAALSRHTPPLQLEHGGGVPPNLERIELHDVIDAHRKGSVSTRNIELLDSPVAEGSLFIAKTKAMTDGLLLLTEDSDQQKLASETAQACGTLPKAPNLSYDLPPDRDPMAALDDGPLHKMYRLSEPSGPTQCDTSSGAPHDGLTTAPSLCLQSHNTYPSDADSSRSGRDSVDTYAPSVPGDLPEQEAETEWAYCPPTAGWLGLHRPISRPRRFSMSLQCSPEHSVGFETRPGTSCSASTVKPPRRKGDREAPIALTANAAMVAADTVRGQHDKKNVVPRMVILIAGLAIAGRMFRAIRH